jgi:deoxycytidine triphosphate deaminase
MGNKSTSNLTNVQEGDSQPNAVDLRLDKVYSISNEVFEISNTHKKHRKTTVVQPDDEGYYNLEVGHYEITMENIVTIGENEAGMVITRSSLNRNGCFLTYGLFDSGYSGLIAGMLHVNCGPIRIQKGTRIGQFLCFDSESLQLYTGDYGLEKSFDKARYS